MVGHYWIIKQALMREADKLVQNGVIREKEDIYYHSIITQRKEEYQVYYCC